MYRNLLPPSDDDVPSQEIETEALKRRHRGYIRGPFSLPEFCEAAALPGKALAIWLIIQHRVRVTGGSEITLPNGLLLAAGVDRNAKARALRLLEEAGLICVSRQPGRAPLISSRSKSSNRL